MNTKKTGKQTFLRVLEYIKKYRVGLAFSLILSAASVVMTLYIPVLVGDAINFIISRDNVNFEAIAGILLKISVLAAAAALTQWFAAVLNNKIAYGVVKDIRDTAFSKISVLPLSYIDTHPRGEIVGRIVSDAEQFADGLLLGFAQLFTGVLTIIGTLVFMITISPSITLVVVLITPLSLFAASFIAKRTYSMFREQADALGKQTAFIEEMLGSQKVLKTFSREVRAITDFDEVNSRLRKSSLRAIFLSSTVNPTTRFVNGLVYAGVGLAGALSVINGGILVGGLVSFLSYANQYTKPFNEISGVIAELQNAFASASRIFELIDAREETPDSPDAKVLTDISGTVAMEDVYFSYTPEKELITGLNLTAKPGTRTAIVGPTGCGKTTLINLLMRFYDVNSGAVRVDGEDIRGVTRASLRAGFGMVLQDTWLKNGTVRENILIGKPDATEEEVIAAAKDSHAHGFIKRLPQGYETVLDEDGGSLSQGQKQLLSITRVMLSRPPMLILDEATSSIDTRTEIRIQQAFARLMEGRTSFIVAHRLSTVQNADVILVMKDGNIIEQGSHGELIAKKGFYASLYESQFE